MKALNLLSPGATNAKTSKNSLKTFILYLSPYWQENYFQCNCGYLVSTYVNYCPNCATKV